jgi:tetratricopeptide (TPR) repeat protein
MSNGLPPDFCPYKGLQPYTEQDRTFFFGRDRDQQIIISNLYAARLTILYGASGIGKSSVLLAGAVPLLKEEPNLSVVVFRDWQDPDFLLRLKHYALEATNKKTAADFSLPLDEFLAQLWQSAHSSSFFVLDQFEEYFLYNPSPDHQAGFEAEFARAVNRRDVITNFLLSMREDSLSKLDRFQGRIPTLMNNMLRLEHLDREAARDAITKPLEVYNRSLSDGRAQVTIEPALISAILQDLQSKIGVDVPASDVRSSQEKPPGTIETPFLQMVLTRLWDEEHAAGSRALRMQTYTKLGRASNIAKTHLDTIMGKLTDAERDAAANVFRYLVTPSGAKIAQEAAALASWTDTTEEKILPILTRLSGQDVRILRPVHSPGRPVLYELFHDVLAQAALNWGRKYVVEAVRRRERERNRIMLAAIAALSLVLLVIAGLLVLTLHQNRRARQANAEISRVNNEIREKNNALEAEEHLRNGNTLSKWWKYDAAIREYNQAIALNPALPEAYSSMGYVLIRQTRYSEAIKMLEDLTSRNPDYVSGHYNLALAYWESGRTEAAFQECDNALTLDHSLCDIFEKDVTFAWVLSSPKLKDRCGDTKSQPRPANTALPANSAVR